MPTQQQKFSDKQKLISQFANALASPIRITILEKLAQQSCCYHGDLSDELPIAKSTLSQHLTVLKDAGLIQGEIQPPKTKYCIHKTNWALAQKLFSTFFNDLSLTESCKK